MVAQEIGVAAAGRGAVARAAAGETVEDFWRFHGWRLVPAGCARDKGGVLSASLAPLRRIAAFALPPRCPGCGAVTIEDHQFCATCWDGLRFLGQPWCAACSRPFEIERGDSLCGVCLADPPIHDGVRAAVAYGQVARTVILKFKYGRRLAYADTLARLMARLVPEDAELMVPVPLHRWRLWTRGFNQAQLIAQGVERLTGLPVALDLLARTKGGGSLRGRGRKARAKSVRGAFELMPDAADRLSGRHVVLVDDVHTSGATASACASVLKRGGAAKVTVLCWARVLGDDAAD